LKGVDEQIAISLSLVEASLSSSGYSLAQDLICVLASPAASFPFGTHTDVHRRVLNASVWLLVDKYTDHNGLQPIPVERMQYPSYPSVSPNWMGVRLLTKEWKGASLSPFMRTLLSNPVIQSKLALWQRSIVRALISTFDKLTMHTNCPGLIEQCWPFTSIVAARYALGSNWSDWHCDNGTQPSPHFMPFSWVHSLLHSLSGLSPYLPTLLPPKHWLPNCIAANS